MSKVLAICLDGYEPSLGIEMMRDGTMPALSELAARSARFDLDHGAARRTGLAGEHVASGLSPADADRWAAVHFDAEGYNVWQEGTSMLPFLSEASDRAIVFDPTYFDLHRTGAVRGLVNWGAHDPGVAANSRPPELMDEIVARFGEYPARRWIYGLPWNSVSQAQEMGDRLTEAVELRTEIAQWLLGERLADWELALLTVSEAHSVIEGMWHGVDVEHPLHGVASASAAGAGVRGVYRGIDTLIAKLSSQFPDATVVLFSMHGMGPNRGDAPSLLLLAELMYRSSFGKPLFDRQGDSDPEINNRVALPDGETWTEWVAAGFPRPSKGAQSLRRLVNRYTPYQAVKRRLRPAPASRPAPRDTKRLNINWIPATRYRPYWPQMRAFALPSYYDGRVRINLSGREQQGMVAPEEYQRERERIIGLVRECTDPITGEPVLGDVEFPECRDPRELSATEADIIFVWRGAATGFTHPELGQIGPVPYRRTGGHTGSHGFAYIAGAGMAPGDYGMRSAFDVAPTLLELIGADGKAKLSGSSLLQQAQARVARSLSD